MADKGKRIASRQAQLKRRKRKGKVRAQHFDAGPTEGATASPEAAAPEAPEATAPDPAPPSAPATSETLPAPARSVGAARTARRTRAAARAEASAIYPYLGVELRHIGVLTAVLAVALVVLTLLLR